MSAWPLSSDRRFYPRMVARVGPRSFRIDYPKGLANGIRMLKYLFAGGRVGKPIMNLCSFTAGAVADHHPFSLVSRVPGQNFSVEKVYLAGRTLRRFGGYFEVLPILDLQLSNRLKLQLFEVVGQFTAFAKVKGSTTMDGFSWAKAAAATASTAASRANCFLMVSLRCFWLNNCNL